MVNASPGTNGMIEPAMIAERFSPQSQLPEKNRAGRDRHSAEDIEHDLGHRAVKRKHQKQVEDPAGQKSRQHIRKCSRKEDTKSTASGGGSQNLLPFSLFGHLTDPVENGVCFRDGMTPLSDLAGKLIDGGDPIQMGGGERNMLNPRVVTLVIRTGGQKDTVAQNEIP